MKGYAMELPSSRKLILPILSVFFLTIIPLYLRNSPLSPLHALEMFKNGSRSVEIEHVCNVFRGDWVLGSDGPYYTDETNCEIDQRQNCMKFGRPDTEFMRWRWKPDECELPRFNASQFLEAVTGKTMAFIGDSVGRNQMQSLVCLLASAANPIDISHVNDTRFRRWLYPSHNFTLLALWSPLLVKYRDADTSGFSRNSVLNLYLDEADETWTDHTDDLDFVIFSAGQWFFRPFIYYENNTIVGCFKCERQNITELPHYYGYQMAFRTAFQTLLKNENYKGITFLRTYSPSHFENGDWNKGGNCIRTNPFTKQEMKLDGYNLASYMTQVEEFRTAEKEAEKRGLKFRLLDTTEAMVLRPDGHPNYYGHSPQENRTLADCVHWCLPGPIDTWNEFLLQMLKAEGNGNIKIKLQTED
ncbi:hypothetical protein ACET3Z_011171 [Daucus carota]